MFLRLDFSSIFVVKEFEYGKVLNMEIGFLRVSFLGTQESAHLDICSSKYHRNSGHCIFLYLFFFLSYFNYSFYSYIGDNVEFKLGVEECVTFFCFCLFCLKFLSFCFYLRFSYQLGLVLCLVLVFELIHMSMINLELW